MNARTHTLAVRAALLLGLGALLPPAASGHHSAAVYFRMDQEIAVEGVVKAFQLGNPHARIYFTVTGEDGQEQDWMAEGGSRMVMVRKGWTGDEVKPGDRITIIGHPSRDGSPVVHWQWLVTPDGERLWGEDLEPSRLEQLRRQR
jgi:phenylpropionate dioxygenase-like ring-hydroxylating dioxygenase large terminal subunit